MHKVDKAIKITLIVRGAKCTFEQQRQQQLQQQQQRQHEKSSPNEKQYHYNRHNNTESINNYSHKIASMKVATTNSLIFRTKLRGTFCFHRDLSFFFGGVTNSIHTTDQCISLPTFILSVCVFHVDTDTRLILFLYSFLWIGSPFE